MCRRTHPMSRLVFVLVIMSHVGTVWTGEGAAVANSIVLSPNDVHGREQIQNATDGSVIALLPGTYSSICGVSIRSNLLLRGLGGGGETMLDCARESQHLHVVGPVHVELEGLSFRGGFAQHGGCLSVENGAKVTISDSSFRDCHAPWDNDGLGGAIFANNLSSVRISQSSFKETTATWGGALFVSDSSVVVDGNVTFADVSAFTGGLGAIVNGHIEFSNNITIERCVCDDYGGMLRMHSSSGSIRNNITIRDCHARHGGVLDLYESSTMEVSDGVLVEGCTTVQRAGFAYVNKYSVMIVRRNVVVRDITTGKSGGCFFVDRSTLFVEDNVQFMDAHTESYAGAMYVEDSHIDLRNGVTFERCTSAKDGGAILVETGSAVLAENVTIRGAWAPWLGGALLGYEATMELSDVSFENTFSGLQGGTIFAERDTRVSLTRVTATDCAAKGAGGFLMLAWTSEATLNHVSVQGCRVHAMPNSDLAPVPSLSGCGGALFLFDDSVVSVHNSEFRDCHAEGGGGVLYVQGHAKECHAVLANVSIAQSSAADGGAVYLENGDLNASDVRISDCEATQFGGMGFGQGGRMELERVSVAGCRAKLGGGAVYAASEMASVVVVSSTMVRNEALNGSGGAIGAWGAEVTIEGSVLASNRAAFGGALSAESSRVGVRRSDMSGNQARMDGGAIYVGGSTVLEVNECQVVDCHAWGRGGGLAVASRAAAEVLGHVRVESCSAREEGGGVFVNSTAELSLAGRVEVARSTASRGGGLCSRGLVRLQGSAALRDNEAQVGGGYAGAGQRSRLEVAWGAQLEVRECMAEEDGGGLALVEAASMRMLADEECAAWCWGEQACQPECLRAACNFDHGHCRARFEQAGKDALQACDRGSCSLWEERAADQCAAECARASCDWSESNPSCRGVLDALAACPIFDAAAYHSARQQPRLTFIQPGFGRCVDADCASSGNVCTAIDDGGRMLEQPEEDSTSVVDRGEASGTCADKPRLPSAGFQYNQTEMDGIASLSTDELLARYPGCGTRPLTITGCAAGRNGGGIFHSDCAAGLQADASCFVGGMGLGSTPAVLMTIAQNSAGSSGGGVFSECEDLAACSAIADLSLGWPSIPVANRRTSPEVAAVLSVRGNSAGAYGSDMATLPVQLRVAVRRSRYVPGVDTLDLEVALSDTKGQAVRVPPSRAAQYALRIQLLANHSSTLSPLTLRQDFPLPALEFELASLPFRTLDVDAVLPACLPAQDSVQLAVSLVGGPFEARPGPQQVVKVQCAPCPDGFELREEASGWRCVQCPSTHFIVDSTAPAHSCQPCPAGLLCNGTSMVRPVVPGSVWEADGPLYVLRHCPSGYEVRPRGATPVDAASQQCVPCGVGHHCELQECTVCLPCPRGYHKSAVGVEACQVCPADSFTTRNASGHCDMCPSKSTTRGVAGATGAEACVCDDDHYAAVGLDRLECVPCPDHAICEASGSCLLRGLPSRQGHCESGALLGEWEVENATGHLVLVACPPEYELQWVSSMAQRCQPRSTPGLGAGGSGASTSLVLAAALGGAGGVLVLVAAGVTRYVRRERMRRQDALAELRRSRRHLSGRSLVPPTDALELARKGDERAQTLVHGMFPRHVAEALVRGDEKIKEDRSESCAVFFSDIVGFTDISSKLEAVQVNNMLDRLFEQFDALAAHHGVYKIDTIGDCYIGVTHLVVDQSHQQHDQVARIAAFSLDALAAASSTLVDPDDESKGYIKIRVGFDVGPVVGHVQGRRQKKYTIFGNTVNTASRMESTGVQGRIQCTQRAAACLREQDASFQLERRGEVEVKGRGLMETFFVTARVDGCGVGFGADHARERSGTAGERTDSGETRRGRSDGNLNPGIAWSRELQAAGLLQENPVSANGVSASNTPTAAAADGNGWQAASLISAAPEAVLVLPFSRSPSRPQRGETTSDSADEASGHPRASPPAPVALPSEATLGVASAVLTPKNPSQPAEVPSPLPQVVAAGAGLQEARLHVLTGRLSPLPSSEESPGQPSVSDPGDVDLAAERDGAGNSTED